MKITVDPERCTGHAQCAAAAPDIYALDDLGYALPIDVHVLPTLADRARSGARACPEGAIHVEE